MNIRTEPGARVVYMAKGGYPDDVPHANKVLTKNMVYTVRCVEIDSWSSLVYLEGIKGGFNTVMFDNVTEDEEVAAAEEEANEVVLATPIAPSKPGYTLVPDYLLSHFSSVILTRDMQRPVIQYQLIKTERRLTFNIQDQMEETRWRGDDDGAYPTFTASNGYQVISRSRMDIQTERLWLWGASDDTRSGSMVFSTNEKRDAAYIQFQLALNEWAAQY